MRERRHSLRPVVEQFESKALLSGAAGAPSLVAAVASAAPLQTIQLRGTMTGRYHTNPTVPDGGVTYVINGFGRVEGVGRASVRGTVHTIGFVAQGHAQGDLVLAGARGTIALHLTGVAQQNGPQGLPLAFTYSITSGTGKHAHVSDSGIATLTTNPQGAPRGRFTLVLNSGVFPID